MPDSKANDGGKDATNIPKIPVTIVTGYLGSGKTTLISYLLNGDSSSQAVDDDKKKSNSLKRRGNRKSNHKFKFPNHKYALANIEYGQTGGVGIRIELSDSTREQSVFCADICDPPGPTIVTDGTELRRLLHDLVNKKDRVDYVLVETSGLADYSTLNLFYIDALIATHFRVDGVIATVDATTALKPLQMPLSLQRCSEVVVRGLNNRGKTIVNEVKSQILVANRVIVTKSDLMDNEQANQVMELVRETNPDAQVCISPFCQSVDPGKLLDIKAFDVEKVKSLDSKFLDYRSDRLRDGTVLSLVLTGDGAIDRKEYVKWIEGITKRNSKLLRSKALIRTKHGSHIVQSVGSTVTSTVYKSSSGISEPNVNTISIFGRELDPQVLIASFNMHVNGKNGAKIELRDKTTNPSPYRSGNVLKFLLILVVWVILVLYRKRTSLDTE